jgi:hypothetical protein
MSLTLSDVRTDGDAAKPRRRRVWRWIFLILAVLVLAGAWLAIRAVQIERNLKAARTALASAETTLKSGDPVSKAIVDAAAENTRTARDAARDPVWSLMTHIPFVGRPFKTTAGIAEIGDRVTHDSLPHMLTVSDQLQSLKAADAMHQLPLPAMRQAAQALGTVDTQLQDDLFALQHLPAGNFLATINDARTKLLTQLDDVTAQVHTAAVATKVGVPMLGANGDRRYVVLFENPAETRADMGLIGGYAELVAHDGHLHVAKLGTNSDLPPIKQPTGSNAPIITAGYEKFGVGTNWLESNFSPDFGANAGVIAGAYSASTGQHVDGVIALDPVAMGAILNQAGRTVTVPGAGTVSGNDLPAFLESTEYRLPLDETTRKDLLADVGKQTLDGLLASHPSTLDLARTLASLAGTGHLRLASTHPAEQGQLQEFPIAGALPTTTQPFVGAYVNNAAGTKLDYYLDESLDYRATSCKDNGTTAQVTVTLTNNVPARGVPDFVLRGNVAASRALVPGHNRVLLSVVLSPGARITKATVDGQPVTWALQSVERANHPVSIVSLDLPPRQAKAVALSVTMPKTHGPALLATQPLPRAPKQTIAYSCR